MVGYKAVKWDRAVPLHPGIDTRIAAAAYLQGLTALTFLREAYPVQKGDWILIQAAAGGVGLQLVQVSFLFIDLS
jgi:NADPH:quinone reductase